MKTLIYLPAFNQAAKLPQVIARIPESVLAHAGGLLVVDNASTDGTSQAAARVRRERGLEKLVVISNVHNVGYGGSQKIAYAYAVANGYDCVVMLHADGQYAPERLTDILAPLERGEADMVFGSRLAGDPRAGNMPLHRLLGNRALTGLANLVLGWNLTEFHSGYRAYRCAALRELPLERLADYYQFDVEILIQMRQKRFRVVEIPIPTHYGDEKSYINVWRAGLSILGILGEFVLHRVGVRRSRKFDLEPASR